MVHFRNALNGVLSAFILLGHTYSSDGLMEERVRVWGKIYLERLFPVGRTIQNANAIFVTCLFVSFRQINGYKLLRCRCRQGVRGRCHVKEHRQISVEGLENAES
jgi:hypothetical protein